MATDAVLMRFTGAICGNECLDSSIAGNGPVALSQPSWRLMVGVPGDRKAGGRNSERNELAVLNESESVMDREMERVRRLER